MNDYYIDMIVRIFKGKDNKYYFQQLKFYENEPEEDEKELNNKCFFVNLLTDNKHCENIMENNELIKEIKTIIVDEAENQKIHITRDFINNEIKEENFKNLTQQIKKLFTEESEELTKRELRNKLHELNNENPELLNNFLNIYSRYITDLIKEVKDFNTDKHKFIYKHNNFYNVIAKPFFEGEFAKFIKKIACEIDKKQIRLRLLIEPIELQSFPWEYIIYKLTEKITKEKNLIINDNLSLVHLSLDNLKKLDNKPLLDTLRVLTSLKALAPKEKLRILLTGSSMDHSKANNNKSLNIKNMKNDLESIEENFRKNSNIHIKMLELNPTRKEFEKKLEEGWHIIHYMGHGIYNENYEQSNILLASENLPNDVDRYTVSDFRDLIERSNELKKMLRLITFASCNTALGFGYSLSKIIPAVVAMRYEIEVDKCQKGFYEFYDSISKRYPLDRAMNDMRKKLRREGTNNTYCIPVLFLSASDGILFAPEEKIKLMEYLKRIKRLYGYGKYFGKDCYVDNINTVWIGQNVLENLSNNKELLKKIKKLKNKEFASVVELENELKKQKCAKNEIERIKKCIDELRG